MILVLNSLYCDPFIVSGSFCLLLIIWGSVSIDAIRLCVFSYMVMVLFILCNVDKTGLFFRASSSIALLNLEFYTYAIRKTIRR